MTIRWQDIVAHPFPVECPATVRFSLFDGVGYRFEFNNGFALSVVRHEHSIGSANGRWEIAVTDHQGTLLYDTVDSTLPDDVVGHLNEAEVAQWIDRIARLSTNYTHTETRTP